MKQPEIKQVKIRTLGELSNEDSISVTLLNVVIKSVNGCKTSMRGCAVLMYKNTRILPMTEQEIQRFSKNEKRFLARVQRIRNKKLKFKLF